MTRLAFDPALPWPLIAALAALSLIAAAFALWRGLNGWAWRGLAGLAAAAALAGPALDIATRRGLDDIVILLEDRTSSQTLPGRTEQVDGAVDRLSQAIEALPGTELRRVTVGDNPDGTRLAAAMNRAIAAEPEGRIAGIIALTDGRLHDPEALPATAPAPVHVLLTGQPQDWDRRLVIEEAPAFGLINEPLTLRLRMEDQGAVPPALQGRPASLRIAVDGTDEQVVTLQPGTPVEVPITLTHAGANVVSMTLDPLPDTGGPAQLTERNDSAALTITGVRDRLRVLLVSGEPHPGERTWRNLLKSDAGVDLIHFTILRPPGKSDGVPVNEMALIEFPTRELFTERIRDFDLIIFDRYRERGILPPAYFDSIVDYVSGGGAILVAGGPEMASVESLGMTSLGDILPADPTGVILDGAFTPQLTEAGRRHPVTADLPGAPPPAPAQGATAPQPATPQWGRWLRLIETIPREDAEVVMTAGDDSQPLLMFSRVGEGRVALLASDQAWLWARGFEGGGPQLELLRRIAHWAMKEPDLEEEALTAEVTGELRLYVTRRTLAEEAAPVTITGPEGSEPVTLPLRQSAPGRFSAEWTAPAPGLYRLTDGPLSRIVALGQTTPREYEQTVADAELLAPLVRATRGGVLSLSDGVPALRTVREGRNATGRGVGGDWIAITPRGAETVSGRTQTPLFPSWAWLALVAGLALAGWLAEGGRWSRARPPA